MRTPAEKAGGTADFWPWLGHQRLAGRLTARGTGLNVRWAIATLGGCGAPCDLGTGPPVFGPRGGACRLPIRMRFPSARLAIMIPDALPILLADPLKG
jgi:hypothetical protein